jgi:hypothetical protein
MAHLHFVPGQGRFPMYFNGSFNVFAGFFYHYFFARPKK